MSRAPRTPRAPRAPKARFRREDLALAQALVQCRAQRNLSLEDVARAIGLSPMTLSNIETGKKAPRRTTRAKLEAFLRKHGAVA